MQADFFSTLTAVFPSNPWDQVLLSIVAVSALLGIWRGFVREAISLASWVLAVILGLKWASHFENLLEPWIADPALRHAATFFAAAALILLAGSLVGLALRRAVHQTGLRGTDRLMGFVFGVPRGILMGALLVWIASTYTSLPKQSSWQDAKLLPHLEPVVAWFRAHAPTALQTEMQQLPEHADDSSLVPEKAQEPTPLLADPKPADPSGSSAAP